MKVELTATRRFCLSVVGLWLVPFALAADPWLVLEGDAGIGHGKRAVLISGDEEYRSEEAMPMLGKLLAVRHGFKCTVLFAINKQTGEIDPNTTDNIPGLQALNASDLMIVFLRYRDLPAEQLKWVDAYLQTGRPVIGIRPSVVAFRNKPGSQFQKYSCGYKGDDYKSGFGQQVLGSTWISHHGRHKIESTRGLVVEQMKSHPVLRGVGTMWGPSDVYTVRTPIPQDGKVLVMGQVLKAMDPRDPPSDKPQMPLAWTKSYPTPKGDARVFMTTMGSSQDFLDEHFRRMVVNACFWAVGLEEKIPARTNVDFVGGYKPRPFGFNTFQRGLRVENLAARE
ncbi:MAG: ThuA domain-containing protein [Verrucomicrobiia bacterium]